MPEANTSTFIHGRYDRHSFGVLVSKQNVKSFENITQSFQSDRDGRTRGNFAKCGLGIKSRCQTPQTRIWVELQMRRISCDKRQTSPGGSLGKEGSKLTQALFTILWSPGSTRGSSGGHIFTLILTCCFGTFS